MIRTPSMIGRTPSFLSARVTPMEVNVSSLEEISEAPSSEDENEADPAEPEPLSVQEIQQQLSACLALSPLAVDVDELKDLAKNAAAAGVDAGPAYATLTQAEEAQKLANDGTQCDFYFLLADKVQTLDDRLPVFQELMEHHPDSLLWRPPLSEPGELYR